MNIQLFIKAFVAFFVIIDSIGNTPIFIALMKDMDRQSRRNTINKAVLVASGIFLFFAFFGSAVLGYLGISMGALRVAGGGLLLVVAFTMIHGHSFSEDLHPEIGNIAVTPMAVPLMAGPAALTTVMLYMNQAQGVEKATILVALFGSLMVSWLVAIYAEAFGRRLRPDALAMVTQILGVLLAALAVEMTAGGLKDIFPLLG